MKKLVILAIVMICQMMTMTAMAQNLGGKWKIEPFTKNLGDGIQLQITGTYDFKETGSVKAQYNTVTTMTKPENDDNKVKSVFLEISIDGAGMYTFTDNTLNVNLENYENNFRMGEGADNTGADYKAADSKEQEFVNTYFGAFAGVIADGFKSTKIEDAAINGNQIKGIIMDCPVIMVKMD